MTSTGPADGAGGRSVAVVGGGIAGLAAAWELVNGPEPVRVTVLESADRLGGVLRSAPFAGRTVDLSADCFPADRPEAVDLSRELGLDGDLVAPGTSGASIVARGRLRRLPAGLQFGVPTRWWPLARSGILAPRHALALSRDVLLPHWPRQVPIGDRPVAEIIEERLGRRVVEQLVDPIAGGGQAGGIGRLSAAATFPVLIAVGHQPGSLMRRLRTVARSSPADGSLSPPSSGAATRYRSLTGGVAGLADRLAGRLAGRGVTLLTGSTVDGLTRGEGQWELEVREPVASGAPSALLDHRRLTVDGVVVATPASQAAVLLGSAVPVAAGILGTIGFASVAVVLLSFDPGALRSTRWGTGFMVPRSATVDGRPPLVTSCAYLSDTWPHLDGPGDILLRVTVGWAGDTRYQHLDDDELTAAVVRELDLLVDLEAPPLASVVMRWPEALPQYDVGHLIRVALAEQAVREVPGIALCGASYRGSSIPACIAGGRAAAADVVRSMTGSPRRPDPSDGRGPHR